MAGQRNRRVKLCGRKGDFAGRQGHSSTSSDREGQPTGRVGADGLCQFNHPNPGTVAIAVQDDEITVHALMNETAEGLRTDDMNQRVCAFMGYAPGHAPTAEKETSST